MLFGMQHYEVQKHMLLRYMYIHLDKQRDTEIHLYFLQDYLFTLDTLYKKIVMYLPDKCLLDRLSG